MKVMKNSIQNVKYKKEFIKEVDSMSLGHFADIIFPTKNTIIYSLFVLNAC